MNKYFYRVLRNRLHKIWLFGLVRHRLRKLSFNFFPTYQKLKTPIPMDLFLNQFTVTPTKLLLFFPVISWNSRIQRPQHLAREYRNDGFLVLYPTMSIHRRSDASVYLENLEKGIFQVWLHGSRQVNLYQDEILDFDIKNITDAYRQLIQAFNPKEIVIFVEYPIWAPLVITLKESFPNASLVYDCLDDHSDFKNANPAINGHESSLLQKSQLVLASSKILYEKLAHSNVNVQIVRNACDFEFFRALDNVTPNAGGGRKVIGYFGAISDWFDDSLIYEAALKLPEITFKLIGATTGGNVDRLKKLPNVEITGEIPYSDLPALLKSFNVGIIPFKIQPLTIATNPVKVYEYFSQGKPVVAVNLPELKALEPMCYIAHDNEEFIRHLEAALNENNQELELQRIAFAAANQWFTRYSEIKHFTSKL